MTSQLVTWAVAHSRTLAYAGASLLVAGAVAAAMRWRKESPLPVLRFHPDGLTRPLSNMDLWYSMHNLAHTQPNFYIATMLTGKPWTAKQAEIVLTKVMARHPPSMCKIVNADDPARPPYWRRLWHTSYAEDEQGILDIRFEQRASEAKEDLSWRDFARTHEGAGFSVSEPRHSPFRFVIVSREGCPHFELIFIPDHAICDGRGAVYFVRQLLEEYAICEAEGWDTARAVDLRNVKIHDSAIALGKKAKDADVLAKTANNEIHWPAEIEAHTNVKPGLWFLIKILLADKFAFFRPKTESWIGPADRGAVLRPTPALLWSKVPAPLVASLRALCRTRKTTINAALWSAVVFALFRTFRRALQATSEAQTGHNPAAKDGAVTLRLENPIDLRSRFDVPISHLAPLIIGTDFEVTASLNTAFWKTAASVQEKIVEAVPVGIKTNGLISFIDKPSVPWVFGREARAPNGRRDTLKISNLGCLDFERSYGSLACHDVWFGRHTVRDGCLFTLFVLTPGEDRGMNLAITSPSELHYGPEATELFTNTLIEVLTKAVDNANTTTDFTFTDTFKGE